MLSNIRIVTKIRASSALSAFMIAVIAVIGVITMTRVADETIALHDDDVIPMTYLEEVHASEIKSRLDLHRVAVAGTDAERQQRLTGLQETDAQLAAATASYKRTSPLAESAAMKQYESNWAKYIQIRDQQLLPLAMRGDTAGFSKLHAEVAQPVLSEAADGIDSLVDQHGQGSTAAADAADRDYTSGLAWIIGISLVSLLAFVVASQLITRTIVRPLQRMRQALSALAAGDLTSTTGITSTDELGQMATDLDIAITSTRETIKSVGVDAERTAWVATQTASLNQDIAQHADETSQRSESVNQTAQAVSENVHTVASATEEMRSSIAEIGNSSTQASTVAGEAVIVARTTNDTINRLSSSSAEIDSVVRVITSIAEQTNLLALNATIEAARAGAAGKGFAVVASEVKDLAQETARATTGIVSQIGAIQTDTASAVDAIGQIVRIIDQIAQYQETIAAAVEEQTASAGEIGRSLLDASEGSATIASNMHEVNQSAQATTGSIGEAIKASSDLTTVSRELQDLIGRFRY